MIAKKITLISLLLLFLMTIALQVSVYGKTSEIKSLHFQVDMRAAQDQIQDKNTIGLRGNMAPLNWETTYVLKDDNDDGIYETTLDLKVDAAVLEFKFVYDDVVWELATETNRTIDLSIKDNKLPIYRWNEPQAFTQVEIKAMSIPKEQLLEDFELVKTAYTTMHPGLYRYNTPEQVEQNLANLKADLSADLTIPEVYVAFSRFVATIKCGHTYANFWNQPSIVKRSITYQADKVPFHFRLVGNRMMITESAIETKILKRGKEVLTINGNTIASILSELKSLVRADGGNTGPQTEDLQLFGADKFETFDMYFSLLFPPSNGQYALTLSDIDGKNKTSAEVPAMSKLERVRLIKKQFPKAIPETTAEDLWQFKILNEETALLTLHTFSIWNWDMDWKAYIKGVFDALQEKNIPNLIIDIRRNGGGNDMVSLEILKFISQQDIVFPARKELSRFTEFPTTLKPYLKTWDYEFETKTIKKFEPIGNGYYALNGKMSPAQNFKPFKNNYKGNVYMLIGPANSSATYYMAGAAQRTGAATLVGQETGGNQRGINGGLIYFLTLPNSHIELDIPVVGDFQIGESVDGGYLPDILVEPTVEDIAEGIDTELMAVMALIATKDKK